MTHFHNMGTKIAIIGVVCLVYVHCLFLRANEGRKDESLTSGTMQNTSSTVKLIDTMRNFLS